MSVANLEVATEIMSENFDMGLWGNMYDAGLVWHIGDSTGASSVYLDYPESEGLFAYYNDDSDTDTGPPRDLYLASNIIEITGEGNVYLMMDMFLGANHSSIFLIQVTPLYKLLYVILTVMATGVTVLAWTTLRLNREMIFHGLRYPR